MWTVLASSTAVVLGIEGHPRAHRPRPVGLVDGIGSAVLVWADAAAALLVGCVAVALAIATWAHDLRGPTRPTGTHDIAGG